MSEQNEKVIANLSDTLTHNALEKEDIRLEGKIDSILESINGENGINKKMDSIDKQVKFTNGKVRAHEKWISGIVGGALVVMAGSYIIRDYFVQLTAEAVVRQIEIKYDK